MKEASFSEIEVSSWKRKEHFEKWITFDEPFHGVTVLLDITECVHRATEGGYKVFPRYMYHLLFALNEVEPMRYRILDGKPICYDEVLCGLVVMNQNDTFAYGQIQKNSDFEAFHDAFEKEKVRVKERGTLHDSFRLLNLTHFSVLPWTNFVSLSHARKYGDNDSIPKITFGKIHKEKDRYRMPMSIHVHHALVDGRDVGQFIDCFQNRLNLG